MTVCPRCNGNGSVPYHIADDLFDETNCPLCGGSGEVITEQEYLQTATTEQLAEWICSVHEKCYYCGAKRISDRERCPFGDGKCRNNKHEFAMWLKQPHTPIS